MSISSIDLHGGFVVLMDGQHVPITRYLGTEEGAPEEGNGDVPELDSPKTSGHSSVISGSRARDGEAR